MEKETIENVKKVIGNKSFYSRFNRFAPVNLGLHNHVVKLFFDIERSLDSLTLVI